VSILSPIERSADYDANGKVNSFVPWPSVPFYFFSVLTVNVEAASADRTRRQLTKQSCGPRERLPSLTTPEGRDDG
jgi:hypothetical protein